jgi:hypothetical protein
MSVYRQIKGNVIVNRIVVDDAKGLPADFPERETYELETEDPPPQIGWTRNAEGGFDPPPDPVEAVPLPAPEPSPLDAILEQLVAITKRLDALEAKAAR